MLEIIRKNILAKLGIFFYILLTFWWIEIAVKGIKTDQENYLFGGVYGSMALFAGVIAFFSSQHWGGLKSIMGRAILFIGIGLLLQTFGQYVFWYYNFFAHVEIPYPSFADVGYFGSIPCYIYASILFAKASGIKVSLKQLSGQLQIILIPLIMLGLSYFLFVQKHIIEYDQLLKTFLDFGYPLGQALYVSIAILVFSLSRGVLGGIMKPRILFIVFAFIMQYVADFTFLFFQDSYYNASFVDYLYLLAYIFMLLALLYVNEAVVELRKA